MTAHDAIANYTTALIVAIRMFTAPSASVLKVHPQGHVLNPMMGGSQLVLRTGRTRWGWNRGLQVQGLEAIDGTPIVDIKPVLERGCDS